VRDSPLGLLLLLSSIVFDALVDVIRKVAEMFEVILVGAQRQLTAWILSKGSQLFLEIF